MKSSLVYLRRNSAADAWEVSLDHQAWAPFPHSGKKAGDVIDEARMIFLSRMVALSGPVSRRKMA